MQIYYSLICEGLIVIMKVYFYAGNQVHNIHKQALKANPHGITYILSNPALGDKIGVQRTHRSFMADIKKLANSVALRLVMRFGLPKIHYARVPKNIDLIHSGHYPLLNKRIPWVMEMEQVTQLTWFNRRLFDLPRNKRFFEKIFASPSCRGILCWTKAARKSLENGLNCETFKEKIHVVPLTIQAPEKTPRAFNSQRLNIFFLATTFYEKGGVETILAAEKASKSHNVHLYMSSAVPLNLQKKYESNPSIHFVEAKNREELIDFYKKADVFIMPAHFEAFGYVFLEAFSYGLPCISTDGYASEEIVEEGVRGRIVKNSISIFDEKRISTLSSPKDRERVIEALKSPPNEYIDRLAKTIVELAQNPNARAEMSKNAYESVSNGKFSHNHRKKLLYSIYSQSIREL